MFGVIPVSTFLSRRMVISQMQSWSRRPRNSDDLARWKTMRTKARMLKWKETVFQHLVLVARDDFSLAGPEV
jgi:hypothetical protein